jgi:hypothetical protein
MSHLKDGKVQIDRSRFAVWATLPAQKQEHKPVRLTLRVCTCGTYSNVVAALQACSTCRRYPAPLSSGSRSIFGHLINYYNYTV